MVARHYYSEGGRLLSQQFCHMDYTHGHRLFCCRIDKKGTSDDFVFVWHGVPIP